MSVNWSSPQWGQVGHNIHVATSGNYGSDAGHDDDTSDQ